MCSYFILTTKKVLGLSVDMLLQWIFLDLLGPVSCLTIINYHVTGYMSDEILVLSMDRFRS
jgi:hypothetical protein